MPRVARARWAIDDVEVDGSLSGGRVGGVIEECGFEVRDAIEAPGGVGEFLSELGLGGGGGLVFVEELAAVMLVGGGILGSENGGAAGEAVRLGVAGGALFAGGGAGSGGVEGIGPILGGAVGVVAGLGGWGRDWVCHECLGAVLAWARGGLARPVVDVVGWEGKIEAVVA
jgi:hypothetical protein